MILKNPTDQDVAVIYNGVRYEIEAGSESEPLSDETALFWKKTHQFLEITEEPARKVKKEVKEEVEETEELEEVEETADEVVAEKKDKKGKK